MTSRSLVYAVRMICATALIIAALHLLEPLVQLFIYAQMMERVKAPKMEWPGVLESEPL